MLDYYQYFFKKENMVLELQVMVLFLLSFLIGGMIGLERAIENKKHPKKLDSYGEVRTFALISFFGSLITYLSIEMQSFSFVIVGLFIFSLFILSYYVFLMYKKAQIGLTTEITGIITFLLGVAVMLGHAYLALVLSILITFLLSSKKVIAKFDEQISREELANTIKFAIISLVILPLLPSEKYSLNDIFGAIGMDASFNYPIFTAEFLNLYGIWFFVVLMSGISYVGYILSKFIGSKGSILASGAVGGLISSTAVTASMTENSKTDVKNRDMYVVSTLLASTIMFVRVIIIVIFFNQALLGQIFFPAFFMFLFMGGYIYYFYRKAKAEGAQEQVVEKTKKGKKEKFESPFQIMPALKFAGFVLMIKFISAVGSAYKDVWGDYFFYALGLIGGLADVDAISQTMAVDSKNGMMGGGIAVITIIIAIISNNFVKGTIALKLGEKKFGVAVFLGFVVSMVGGVLGMVVSSLVF